MRRRSCADHRACRGAGTTAVLSAIAALLLWTADGGRACSLQPDETDAADPREERLDEMRRRAEVFKIDRIEPGGRVELERIGHPLLRFDDPARRFHDATLWAWGGPGRPSVVLTMEQYGSQEQPAWWYELVSLAAGPVEAATADGLRWSPREPGVELQSFAEAPDPAGTPAARLRQMRELARRFSAHEFGRTGQRYELRLMAQPIHRYADPDAGLLDGAIFVLAYGTNPEVLLLIEAHQDGTTRGWRYGFARAGAAALHVHLDHREVWTAPYAHRPTPQDTYWFFQRK